MRDPRSPELAPEAGATEKGAAGTRRTRRTGQRHRGQRGATLRYVLREARRAGAVAVAAQGTMIWLKQPDKGMQKATQPAAAAETETQRDTRTTSRQRRNAARPLEFQQRKSSAYDVYGCVHLY